MIRSRTQTVNRLHVLLTKLIPAGAPTQLTADSAASGDVVRHRLSRAGDRQLNHALYMMALSQIRHDTDGPAYYQRKRAAGKGHKEAMRCLKRRLSDTVYRQLLRDAQQTLAAGPGGHSGAALTSSAAD